MYPLRQCCWLVQGKHRATHHVPAPQGRMAWLVDVLQQQIPMNQLHVAAQHLQRAATAQQQQQQQHGALPALGGEVSASLGGGGMANGPLMQQLQQQQQQHQQQMQQLQQQQMPPQQQALPSVQQASGAGATVCS